MRFLSLLLVHIWGTFMASHEAESMTDKTIASYPIRSHVGNNKRQKEKLKTCRRLDLQYLKRTGRNQSREKYSDQDSREKISPRGDTARPHATVGQALLAPISGGKTEDFNFGFYRNLRVVPVVYRLGTLVLPLCPFTQARSRRRTARSSHGWSRHPGRCSPLAARSPSHAALAAVHRSLAQPCRPWPSWRGSQHARPSCRSRPAAVACSLHAARPGVSPLAAACRERAARPPQLAKLLRRS